MIRRYLPFLDLFETGPQGVSRDVAASLAVTFLAVPQGVAYAMIAGLPPAMGLYAAAIPTIVGSLFRSSKHVVSGPTNAISLLIGGAVAATTGDPLLAAATIAFTVGLMQTLAGLLGLGAIVDYVSGSVVLGYITGAGVLIGVGQLGNVTGTFQGSGHLLNKVGGWAAQAQGAHLASVVLALGTVAGMVLLRRFAPRVPAAIVAMGAGTLLSWALDLGSTGMVLVRDLSPMPEGLPPLTMPDLSQVAMWFPVSLAATLLSLIESSSVGRGIASRTGQRLDTSIDFYGQGLANLAAAFTGGYPVSGSLSRSALNERAGAQTRLAGTLSGVFMLGVLVLFGGVVDHTPVPSLAGILLVVAANLVDLPHIREVLRASTGDRLAFAATVLGTWTLPLDQAILLGVGISIVLFLRRVRHLVVREMVVDPHGHLREANPEGCTNRSSVITVLHIEGNLFFGAASELQRAIDDALRDRDPKVLVVRLKRTQGLDLTTASVLLSAHDAARAQGRTLLLAGLRPAEMTLLSRTGIAAQIGDAHLYPTQPGWFVAMDQALHHAVELAQPPADDPIRRYVGQRPDPQTAAPTSPPTPD